MNLDDGYSICDSISTIMFKTITCLMFLYVCGVGTLTVFMFRSQIKSSKWSSQPLSHIHTGISPPLSSFIASFILPVCLKYPLLFVILDSIQSAASGTRLICSRTALTFRDCGTIFPITSVKETECNLETKSYDTADKVCFKLCLILVLFNLKNNNL